MNKLLVIITDGEDFSRNLSEVRKQASEIGLHIITYGVGTVQGAPVPIIGDDGNIVGYEKNEEGNVIMSHVNVGILESLAHETGGIYVSPTQDEDDIKEIVSYVERYEKEALEDKELSKKEEKYWIFAAMSLVCLLVEWVL